VEPHRDSEPERTKEGMISNSEEVRDA